MSSEFYFQKWKKTLAQLEEIANLDVEYQTTKAHDKDRCDATLRLSAMLGQYMTIYNHIMECKTQNLQVQKTEYMEEAMKAVVARISELKHELIKLDSSEHHFLNNGLIYHKLTTFDAELTEIPSKEERSEQIQRMIEEVIEKVNEKKRQIEEQKILEDRSTEEAVTKCWWDEDAVDEKVEEFDAEEKKKELTEEEKEIKKNMEIIQAHEKTRQVIAQRTQAIQKRVRWQKEIEGTCAQEAPYEIRERSAALIQKVYRAYFKCKRQRYLDCKRDELLDLKLCTKPKNDAQEKFKQVKTEKPGLKEKYVEDCKLDFERIKENYRKLKGDEICESYRDNIMDWFRMWFDDIRLFYDIPDDKAGGSKLILKEELPTPEEYLEEYKAYIASKKANKNQSSQQMKSAKLEAKLQAAMEKKVELQRKRQEADLKRKLMKDPSKHPGFDFPESKKTEHILKAIEDYHTDWDEYDKTDILEVKEKHFTEVERKKAFMEVAMEAIPQADEIMRKELKKLREALKKDYIANEEEMPKPMKKKRKKERKKKKVKNTFCENLAEKMEELVFRGFIKEYPKTELKDFIGDPNFAGDDLRCNFESALPFHGEMRRMWWEKCRDMTHGFRKILVVGPKGGGKTVLLHAIASMNDAILFELDPSQIRSELAFDVYLDQVVQYVVACAKAAQPSVIHIKHVHRFYYKSKKLVPKEDAELNLEVFKRHFTKKLFKKINKLDKITVIGSCVDPWLTKSKQMLKHFPNVVLLPNTNYSAVVELLNEWVLSNHVVPSDLSVSCLAHVLQGYSFGYLKEFLNRFLTAERIAWISAHGLSPQDVFNGLLEDDVEKVDYAKYLKWYTDRTTWGKREKEHHEEQLEFKEALQRWALKKEMEKRKAANRS